MAAPGKVIISARGIRKHHGVREILSDVTLSLHEGDRLGLLGANGAGKTTILRILAGVDKPDNGELTFARGLEITLLEQEFRINPASTVREAVEGGMEHILAWKRR